MAEPNYNPEARPDYATAVSLLDIIKNYNYRTNQEFPTRWTNINDLLSPVIEPTFENIQGSPYTNEQLNAILTALTRQTIVNSQEILFLHRLIALLTLEILNQGVKIEDKELIENLEIYCKK